MKTKILATIGPASNKRDVLSKLIAAGVRIFRLNFSHGDSSSFVDLIKMIRELEIVHKTPITILQDLSGPKIRIGTFPNEGSLNVLKGDQLLLGPSSLMCNDKFPYIPFDHPEIFAELEQGDRLVLADGTLQFRVVEHREDGLFKLEANNNGIVTSRKGLALPGKSIPLPALTEKDKKDLVDGLALGVDAVALSFVQSPEDIREAKSIIRSHSDRDIPVIAKLERRNAVDRLDAILKEVDIVMVARGDLGIECPLPELPAMQKRIIRACNRAAKPVIVATQMLLSMVSSPSPTRAETTDVANAVLDGADCVMLSEETAMGNYPACLLAQKANAKSIVAHSLSGTSARLLSARRPVQTIHALTPDVTSLKALNFSWGVLPHQVGNDNVGHLARAERFIASSSLFGLGEDVVITAGQPTSSSPQPRGTNLVKIYRK